MASNINHSDTLYAIDQVFQDLRIYRIRNLKLRDTPVGLKTVDFYIPGLGLGFIVNDTVDAASTTVFDKNSMIVLEVRHQDIAMIRSLLEDKLKTSW